jgi:Flp pilus assembly secretin CpaC
MLAAGGSAGAQATARDPWPPGDATHRSHILVPALTRFPLTRKITIGVDKSMLIELPVDLQNVLVSNPAILDAVVQSSRQVYLLGKDVGDDNAFFIGADGQKLVFPEVTVARDLTALSDALARLIPGSQIKAEAVGDNVVLTGSVINPIDANRAAELAGRYTKKRDAVVIMLAVGEFPVPVSSEDRQVSVSWKNFGVSLSFTPVVMSQGRTSLNISAEVSELTSDGAVTLNDIAIAAFKVRRAKTTLELRSGGTLAMAGLISDDTRQSVEGVPGIKNIPILGALLRSNDYRRKESELVLLVTPYLATHAAKADFARPDQGFAPSSTLQELFLGHINRIYGVPGHVPRGRYEGEYGFIVEFPNAGVKA